jgi:hypothetical protein
MMGDRDAQEIYIWLMRGLENRTAMETRNCIVERCRAKAHQALTADDYRACVANFLEVSVDARVYLLRRGQIDHQDDADDQSQL